MLRALLGLSTSIAFASCAQIDALNMATHGVPPTLVDSWLSRQIDVSTSAPVTSMVTLPAIEASAPVVNSTLNVAQSPASASD